MSGGALAVDGWVGVCRATCEAQPWREEEAHVRSDTGSNRGGDHRHPATLVEQVRPPLRRGARP